MSNVAGLADEQCTCGESYAKYGDDLCRCKLPTSRPVMNSPADEAEARDRANTAPRQADPAAPGRGETGVSSGSEARPVIATERHTPGPWRWELNLTSRVLQLVGGKPTYDMTVMDFRRWGMNGAQPRFIVDGLLYKAEDFKRVAPEREHHARWFQLIDHPDANLIAAAPELLFALKALVAWQAEIKHAVPLSYLNGAKAAIAQAEGRS